MNTIKRLAPTVGGAGQQVVRALQIDDKLRQVDFVASDESVDRFGDVVLASGWRLESFRANPILLYGHQQSSLPIGTVPSVQVIGKRLIARAQFLPAGAQRFADEAWAAVLAGALRAVSVGFLPLVTPEPIYDSDRHISGFEFTSQELLELSVVAVPANRNAVVLACAPAGQLKRLPPEVALAHAHYHDVLAKLRASQA